MFDFGLSFDYSEIDVIGNHIKIPFSAGSPMYYSYTMWSKECFGTKLNINSDLNSLGLMFL